MKIGILQTGHAPEELLPTAGDYASMFVRLLDGHGFEFETFNVVDMDFPASVLDADGWLITGSKHGAYEDHAFIPPLEAFIRDARDSEVPLIGVCFGHQIIAQALGGRVEKFAGGWSVGRQAYDFEGQTLHLNAWHQDQVTELPEGAQVIATSPFCANAALAIGDTILTVQAHPEFGGDFITGLIDTRGKGVVPDDLLQAARGDAGAPNDSAAFAARMANFLIAARARRTAAA